MSGPRRTVVLARSAGAVAVGIAVADGVRARARAAAGVVVLPDGVARRTGVLLPASPAARRLATALTNRDISARASGRLVLAAGGTASTAPTVVARVEAAAGAFPVVIVCADPRTAGDEAVLREADAVLAVLPPAADPALHALLATQDQALVADVSGLVRAVPVLAPVALRSVRAAGAALGAGRS